MRNTLYIVSYKISSTLSSPFADGLDTQSDAHEPASRWSAWLTCLALMAMATLFRLYLLTSTLAHLDSDQAVLGLMAFHVQAGDRPIFYANQPYMGSLEAYLAAAVFKVWGATELTVRLPALLCSVLFVGTVYWLGALLYGRWIAVLSGLLVALAPAILITWSTAAGAGYIEAMLCGTLLFILAVYYPDPRAMPLPAALIAGLLAGVGIWMEPLIAEYLLPLAIFLSLYVLLRLRRRPAWQMLILARNLLAIALGAALGAAPFLSYNLANGWQTLIYLQARQPLSAPLEVVSGLVRETLPILVGFVSPTSVSAVFAQDVAAHPLHYLAGLLVAASLLGRIVLDPRNLPLRLLSLIRLAPWERDHQAAGSRGSGYDLTLADTGQRAHSDGLLALFTIICVLGFVFTGFGAVHWATHSPRYLIPIYTVTPLIVGCVVPRGAGRLDRWAAALAVAVLVVTSALTSATADPRSGIDDLTRHLRASGVRVVYTDYWLANRISFLTHEAVLGIAVDHGLRLGETRFPAYLTTAAGTPTAGLAWIMPTGSIADKRLRLILHRQRVRATHTFWRDQTIYTGLSAPLRAPITIRW